MIGKLRGIVDETEDDSVILDVNGVGYLVFCSSRTLAALPACGEMAQLIIETHVREEHIHFYGFPDAIERDWFRLLTTVQRVGNRMALTLLGAYTPAQLSHAILAKDTTAFSRISGVGPKLAERIVTELKDKVGKMPTTGFKIMDSGTAKKKPEPINNAIEDAISALVNLGYSRSEAYGAVMKASEDGDSSNLDQLIKLSLKQLVRA
jgi:holliday junction DNA helicase RuvA